MADCPARLSPEGAKENTQPRVPDIDLDLPGGSLLVMAGTTQRFWKHMVPKQPRVSEGRINLTFRFIHAA